MRAPSTRLGLILATALVGASLAVACSAPAAPKRETAKDLVNVEPDDAAVERATAEARRTLGVFWAKFDSRDPSVESYSLKVGLPVKDGGAEHLWATPLRHDAKTILVRIANDPVYIKNLAYGDEVEVEADLISDWSYTKKGKLFGHFTTRALMPTMTPEQRAEVEGLLAPTPIEPIAK